MKKIRVLFGSLTLSALLSSDADVITDWNLTAYNYVSQNSGWQSSRAMAMVHVAQFDAINAVASGYVPYALYVSAPGASAEAAAAQAAYTVLTNISRSSVSTLNYALTRSLSTLPEGQAKEDGIALGRLAAQTIINLRAADNYELEIPARTNNALGKWRLAPPNYEPGFGAQFRYFLPWSMQSQAQFRPPPPPSLTSEIYGRDVEEARLVGRRVSTNRTPSQLLAANFHYAGMQAYIRPAAARKSLPLIESARAHALYYMMIEDSGIAFLEAQHHYSLWRPIHAIRLANVDGNDATNTETNWFPYFDTPNHPEYPSGTCTLTSSSITILTNFYGNDFAFTATSSGERTRQFTRLTDAIEDAVEARITAGAHYRFSCLAGVELGRRIAEHALNNVLRPLPHLAGRLTESGNFAVHLHQGSPLSYIIEASDDLSQWSPCLTNSSDLLLLNETNTAGANWRFYRAILRP